MTGRVSLEHLRIAQMSFDVNLAESMSLELVGLLRKRSTKLHDHQ